MIDYKQINSVHLEISTRCNAACPLCPRNTAGYDEDLGYPMLDMTLPQAKRIFTPDFLRQIDHILINGNFGDFITAKDNLDIVEYFYLCNPTLKMEISTNGSGGRPGLWERLGQVGNIEIGFALDGLEDTHAKYRRNTNWRQVITNAKKFIQAGGSAVWRMIKFEHNVHQIAACERMSRELGFKRFDLIDQGRNSGPVYDRHGDYVYHLGNKPAMVNFEYPKRIETWKDWSRHGDTNEARLEQYKSIPIKKSIDCMSKKFKQIYVTATGEVYPCCWLGFYPKLNYMHNWQRDNMFLKDLVVNNNALEVGLEDAVKWFNSVEESWNKKTYTEGRLFRCDEACGS